jgi:hypothetical protein
LSFSVHKRSNAEAALLLNSMGQCGGSVN